MAVISIFQLTHSAGICVQCVNREIDIMAKKLILLTGDRMMEFVSLDGGEYINTVGGVGFVDIS